MECCQLAVGDQFCAGKIIGLKRDPYQLGLSTSLCSENVRERKTDVAAERVWTELVTHPKHAEIVLFG